jgi:hypothetical protein
VLSRPASSPAAEGRDVAGIEAQAQQLGINVAAFKFRGNLAHISGHPANAFADGGGAERIGRPRQQTFQEVEVGMQAVHHFRADVMAWQEAGGVLHGGGEQGFVGPAKCQIAGRFGEIPPCHCGLQLVAAGGLRPAGGVARKWLLLGE